MKAVKPTSIILFICFFTGCFLFDDDTDYPVIEFSNNSKTKIQTVVNLDYPDSSLDQSTFEKYIDPNDFNYLVGRFNLKERFAGVTIFIFDYNYAKSIDETKNLDKSKILQKYYLSISQLDSLNWKLNYP